VHADEVLGLQCINLIVGHADIAVFKNYHFIAL
jgi:hypothetical protein